MLAVALVALTVVLVETFLGRSLRLGILLSLLALVLYLPFLAAWGVAVFALVDHPELSGDFALFLAPPVLPVILVLTLLAKRGAPRWLWSLARPRSRVRWPYRLAVDVGVLALWLIGGSLLASARECATDAAWARSFEPMEDLARRVPTGPPNEGAVRLQGLAARLGIELAPGQPAAADKTVFDAVGSKLTAYVGAQSRRTTSGIDPPPTELQALLAVHAADLAAIRGLLRESAVAWGGGPESYRLPPSNLREIEALLLVDALEKLRRGQTAVALDDLEAAWALQGAWRASPALTSQLNAVSHGLRLMGALRQAAVAPEAWTARLQALDYRKPLLRSFQLETWHLSEFARRRTGSLYYLFLSHQIVGDLEGAMGRLAAEEAYAKGAFFRYVQGPFESPYLRVCAADASEDARRLLVDLARRDCCAFDLTAPGAQAVAGHRSWNLVAEWTSYPYHGGLWRRAGRVAVEAELTRRVLQARALAAAAKDRRFPETLPGPDRSVCAGVRIRYARAADGTATLAAEPNPFAAETGSFPLEFRMERP